MLIGTLAVLLGGCASRGGSELVSPDAVAVAPWDFSVDVLILTGELRDPGERVDERPLRLTLAADGSLHAAVDADVSGRTAPARVRTVDRSAVAGIWTTARTLGLLDPEAGSPPVHPPTIRPEPDELIAVVSIRADGRHHAFVERVGGPQVLADDLSRFIRDMARLAWASDRPDARSRVIPRRYDLGDDPYARYRDPQTSEADAG